MKQRTLDLQSTGEYFHIYNRGVNRERIFFSDRDYEYFMDLVHSAFDPASLSIHAFSLMPNHFHFILRQLMKYAMSEFMRTICQKYAMHINYLQKRKGHLFEGPYKMKNFDEKRYLLYITRYVHLNPVQGNLVKELEDWPYTSWHHYLDGGENGLVTTNEVLQFAGGIGAYTQYLKSQNPIENEEIEEYVIDRELA